MTDTEVNFNPTQIEPVTVKITDTDLAAIRAAAEFTPVFSAWQTILLNGVSGDLQPQQILQADLKRRRAWLQVRGQLGSAAQAEGTVTSPGANVAIANMAVTALTPGWYTVQWSVELDGTPGAADVDNFIIKGPGLGAGFTSNNDGAVGRYVQPSITMYVPSGNGTALSVRSVGAGTAGAQYSAQIAITPLTPPPGGFVTLGTYGQVSNNQGGRVYDTDPRWEIRAHSPLWMIGDGVTALNVTLYVERDQGE